MINRTDLLSDFKENVTNINRYYLKSSERRLELNAGYNKIFISKINQEDFWSISFVLLCFDFEYEDVQKSRFKVIANTKELEFLFGIRNILGSKEDGKMILLANFVRFEDYLGVFIKRKKSYEKYPGISFYLSKEIKEAIKKLLEE